MLVGRILELYASAGVGGGDSGMAYAIDGQYGRECTSGQENPATYQRSVRTQGDGKTRTRFGDEIYGSTDLDVVLDDIGGIVCT